MNVFNSTLYAVNIQAYLAISNLVKLLAFYDKAFLNYCIISISMLLLLSYEWSVSFHL